MFVELGQAFAELFSTIGTCRRNCQPYLNYNGLFKTFVETAVPAFAEIGKVIAGTSVVANGFTYFLAT
ncbi:hypothetical protein P7H25_08720 [Paenibacillus larvae]|nr:hypothetical protein [Paenibacillus larvae]MDT2255703.1 hypothetical protein [Paenibacillus larvae]